MVSFVKVKKVLILPLCASNQGTGPTAGLSTVHHPSCPRRHSLVQACHLASLGGGAGRVGGSNLSQGAFSKERPPSSEACARLTHMNIIQGCCQDFKRPEARRLLHTYARWAANRGQLSSPHLTSIIWPKMFSDSSANRYAHKCIFLQTHDMSKLALRDIFLSAP